MDCENDMGIEEEDPKYEKWGWPSHWWFALLY